MTTKIYSRLNPAKLLHMIVREIPEGRVNLCEPEQFLQCASLNLAKGTTFKAHKHIWKAGPAMVIAQEAWVVIKGSVQVFYYDVDETLLNTVYIYPGQASFTFDGYHNYAILEESTQVFEFKTGPYLGIENDKIML